MSVMATVGAPVPTLESATATVRAHRGTLLSWASGSQTKLLPRQLAVSIRDELATVIDRGSSHDEALFFTAKLLAAYPARASDVQADLTAYAALVLDELARYSPEILAAGLPGLWRTLRFRPSVAEICACLDVEVERFRTLRHGLWRMERHREAIGAEQAAAAKRADEARAWGVARDEEAVRQFGVRGVKTGDRRGAERTFMLLPIASHGGRSPWIKWLGLLPANKEWPAWLAVPMRRAGIFGHVQYCWARGQAALGELKAVQKLLVDGDEEAARDLLADIELRPTDPAKAAKADPDRVGEVPPDVIALAEPFRELLIAPAANTEAGS